MAKILYIAILSLTGMGETLNISLNDARRIALENNRNVQIERKNREMSEGEVLKQKGIFDPVLNFSVSYTDAQTPTTSSFIQSGSVNTEEFSADGGVTGTLPTGTFYNVLDFSISRTETNSPIEVLSPSLFTTLGFSVGQELLRNFGLDVNRTPITVAGRSSEISGKELEKTIADTFLRVETSYWNLAATKESLELATTALGLAKDLQRRNEIQVEVGVLPPVTVTQAKSEVAGRQVEVITAENNLNAAEDNLKNILAVSLDKRLEPTDELTTVFKSFKEDEVLKEALEKRPEIEQAKLDVKNKETLKNFFSNQRLPRLAVQGTVVLQGLGGNENPDQITFGDDMASEISDLFDQESDGFKNLLAGEFPTWQVLGIFSFPIFNRTARGDFVKAAADLDRSVITFKQVTESVTLEVRNAIREVENSLRRIEAAKTAVSLAEEVLSNEEERLKVGIGTTREVLEAQRDLVRERFQEIRAVADYNIALATLQRAKGTILESNGVAVK